VRVLGIAGWSGSGKTTLIAGLVPLLNQAGLAVSTIKHAHHGFDLDRPGKDSHRHREAGAREVLVASGRRWALLHELREEPEPALPQLLARLEPVDLVLVEGFKSHPFPKLEVHRPALGKPPLWPDRPEIGAVASDAPLPACPRTVLPLGDLRAVCNWVLQFVGQPRPSA
jgi:molybdopterin-guanine dinucleotide biosynthesis protein B